jgi:hypothetical protein
MPHSLESEFVREQLELRAVPLAKRAPVQGDYVLYWMSSTQRFEENWALRFATLEADRSGCRSSSITDWTRAIRTRPIVCTPSCCRARASSRRERASWGSRTGSRSGECAPMIVVWWTALPRERRSW